MTPAEVAKPGPAQDKLIAAVQRHVPTEGLWQHIGGYLSRSVVLRNRDTIVKCFFHAAESKWQRERRAYEFLSTSDLPVPRMIASGQVDEVPWIAMTALPGRIGAEVLDGASEAATCAAYGAAGDLLARMHGLRVDERLTGMPLADAEYAYLTHLARKLGQYGTASQRTRQRASLLAIARTWAVDLLKSCSRELVCAHGDYSMRNLLLETPRAISGVIDFERCEYADPAVDLVRVLVASPDWYSASTLAFLDAYASKLAPPSRERVLLQLVAIVLDATLWAEEQDPPYFQRLLDLVARVSADPDCFPAVFPRTTTLGERTLSLSLPSHVEAMIANQLGTTSMLEIPTQVSLVHGNDRGRDIQELRLSGPLAEVLRTALEQGMCVRPGVDASMTERYFAMLRGALHRLAPPAFVSHFAGEHLIARTRNPDALGRFLAPYIDVQPAADRTGSEIVDVPAPWLVRLLEEIWGSYAEANWSRIFGHPAVRSRDEGVIAFDTGTAYVVRERMPRFRETGPAFYVSEHGDPRWFVIYDPEISSHKDLFARTLRARLTHAAGRGVHASAVMSPSGRAVLFCGPSGAGKTTHMLSYLASVRGSRLISSDRVLLEQREGFVHAWGHPQAVGIRKGALALVRPIHGVASDPQRLERTHGDASGLNHAYRPEDLRASDGSELSIFLTPREAADICHTEVARDAPVAAIVQLDPALESPVWRREHTLHASVLLSLHTHARADNQRMFWDDVLPAARPTLPLNIDSIPVWTLKARADLERVWSEMPEELR